MDREEWKAKLHDEQGLIAVVIDGVDYARIPHVGDGPDPTLGLSCHDCGAESGQLHAAGCDNEPCPACGDQFLTCGHMGEIEAQVWECGCRLPLGEVP